MKPTYTFQRITAVAITAMAALAALDASAWCIKNSTNSQDGVTIKVAQPTNGFAPFSLGAGESRCDPKISTAADYAESKNKITVSVSTAAGKLGCVAKAGEFCKRTCSNASAYPKDTISKDQFLLLGKDNAQIDVYQRDMSDGVKAGDVFIDLGSASAPDNAPRRFVCK
jgi:hypothetical protein